MIEVKNYHIMTLTELTQKMKSTAKTVSLKNSVGDYNQLRNSLLPSLLKNLFENQHHEYPQKIFEIGTVFGKEETITVFFPTEASNATSAGESVMPGAIRISLRFASCPCV